MKLIARLKPYYDYKEILAALRFSKGNIEHFEKAFARKFHNQFGVMFPYGRSGLYALLKIWDLQDAEIICPAYTCVVVAHAIVKSGNTPVFIDCADKSVNMNLEGIRNSITERTRAIVVTHLFGFPMDVVSMNEIVQKAEQKFGHKIYIIQDAAHSFGARWNNHLVTECGDAAIFGLNISKLINSIFGGMVTTNCAETYHNLRNFRKENFKKPNILKSFKRFCYLLAVYLVFDPFIYAGIHFLERKGLLDSFVKYYDEAKIDLPVDWAEFPTELEARVGLVQLGKYDYIVEQRIQKAKEYYSQFNNVPGIELFPFIEGATYSHFVAIVDNRKKWMEMYYRKGIQFGELIEYTIPYMPAYRTFKRNEYPNARFLSEHIINFPIWAGV